MTVYVFALLAHAQARSPGILHQIDEMRIPAHWSIIGSAAEPRENHPRKRGKVRCVSVCVVECVVV